MAKLTNVEVIADQVAFDGERALELFKLHLDAGYALNGFAGVISEANEFCNTTAGRLTRILSGEDQVGRQHALAKVADSYCITSIESLKKLRLVLKREKIAAQEENPAKGHAASPMRDVLAKKITAALAAGGARTSATTPGRPTHVEMRAFDLRQAERRIAAKKR